MKSKLINNRAKAQQILAFDDLKYGLCRPTDIDLSMDWQQKTFVFVEIKTEGSLLTRGQQIHLEGLVKAITAGGKRAYAIVACHQTGLKEDVHVAQCRTSLVFYGDKRGWQSIPGNGRLSETLNDLYEVHLKEHKK